MIAFTALYCVGMRPVRAPCGRKADVWSQIESGARFCMINFTLHERIALRLFFHFLVLAEDFSLIYYDLPLPVESSSNEDVGVTYFTQLITFASSLQIAFLTF
jgi:hypothetical protein